MKSYLVRLQEEEWSMGNGQCPSCHGLGPTFYEGKSSELYSLGPTSRDKIKIGHKKYCLLAKMMKDYGGKPIMIGKFKPF